MPDRKLLSSAKTNGAYLSIAIFSIFTYYPIMISLKPDNRLFLKCCSKRLGFVNSIGTGRPRFYFAALTVLLAVTAGAVQNSTPSHLITDAALRARVRTQLNAQRSLAKGREAALFGVLSGPLAPAEKEALEFLFAFMPLSDLADYDGAFYLRVVRTTLEARRTMPWGVRIPEEIFLHYVLPHRVNNENLDEARPVIYGQLKDRVKGLSLHDAVLEVNHWCHERVAYKPSDSRTSAPLATICTTWGRCGEESTLTVSALRAVGIPARQVYTPRWAHVDDNHAWVEAWVDGAWHYLGACEPEPELDMAWFTEPAKRAMMVHTKVMGGARGEEKVVSLPWYDEINVLAAYAPALRRVVKVVDAASRPVPGATVEFGLYNYAEFYPLARKPTAQDGTASLVTGQGALRVWASMGNLVGWQVLTGPECTIMLAPQSAEDNIASFDSRPPAEPLPGFPRVAAQAAAANRARLTSEDAMRARIQAGFATPAGGGSLAAELSLDAGAVTPILIKSQGNWREVAEFLRRSPAERRGIALQLLAALSDKDLRDTPAAVLRDHFDHCQARELPTADDDRALFITAVLSPRIAHEIIRPWRFQLQQTLGKDLIQAVRHNPETLIAWVRQRVRIHPTANYYQVPITPLGVLEIGAADPLSRDIFVVACLRAAGVPARLEPATLLPQLFRKGAWENILWDKQSLQAHSGAWLTLSGKIEPVPEYMIQFGLARWIGGQWVTLDFEGKPWGFFNSSFAVKPGRYALTSGNRQADGTVFVRQSFFTLKTGEKKDVELVLRPSLPLAKPLGVLPAGVTLADSGDAAAIDLQALARQTGLVIAWFDVGAEPSRHVLGDLERLRPVFESWGGAVIMAVAGQDVVSAELANAGRYAFQSRWAVDNGLAVLARVCTSLAQPRITVLPVLAVVNKNEEVVFFSAGYRIGVGEQVMKAVRLLGR